MTEQVNLKRSIGLFSLAMINIIAINSIRTVPFASHFGQELIGYFLITVVLFFIPLGLICAHLATRFPLRGGIYIWVRESLSPSWGFFIIWIQWIFNVIWFPSALMFIAATTLEWLNPALIANRGLMVGSIIALFALATLSNWRGMELSGRFTNFCAIIGTMLPIVALIILGYAWMHRHNIPVIDLNKNIFPHHLDYKNISYISAITFGMIGIEMSATHAEEVINPKRNYPRAIFISSLAIILSMIFASLAMNAIIPGQEINEVTGVIQVFHILTVDSNIKYLEAAMAVAIVIGSIGQIGAWIIGPCKSLLVACQDSNLPKFLTHQNKHGVPTTILLIQLGIVTLLGFCILLFPNIKMSYFILTIMTAQLSLIGYIILGIAAFKLTKSHSKTGDYYHIPGGKIGMYSCALLTIGYCILCLVVGFIPPPEILDNHLVSYEVTLAASLLIFICIPIIIAVRSAKPSPPQENTNATNSPNPKLD